MPSVVIRTEKFYCIDCKAHAQLVIVGQYDGTTEGARDHGMTEEFLFGHCARCESPGLLLIRTEASDERYTRQLHPKLPYDIPYHLPPVVDKSYREAIKCAFNGTWLAASVMIRRTLEAIGKDFDSKAKTVFDGLKKMKEDGVISQELYEWGDLLRKHGNIGAHATDTDVSEQDGKEMMEFLDAIIETIYSLRPRFRAMRDRHQPPPQPPQPPQP